jgi:hypothetical protein
MCAGKVELRQGGTTDQNRSQDVQAKRYVLNHNPRAFGKGTRTDACGHLGSGHVSLEDRPVSGFHRVTLTGVGQAFITQGEAESLTVEAGERLIPYIRAQVRDGTLTLGLEGEAQTRHVRPSEINYVVTVKTLTTLWLSGIGDIYVAALDTERLEIRLGGAGDVRIGSLDAKELVVWLDGVGNVELAGQVAKQRVAIGGSGTYRAGTLRSRAASLEIDGSGDATLWTEETLHVRIPGGGSVKYYGAPEVIQTITGVGKLTSLARPGR